MSRSLFSDKLRIIKTEGFEMIKTGCLFLFIIILICLPIYGQAPADILQMALDSIGLDRADIGYKQKGYWNRYPLDTPYRLTSFDDLFAEPLMLYDYSKTMANAVEKYMAPAYLDSNSISLYALTYSLGVDRKQGGFRSYSANLIPISDSIKPLEKAFGDLFESAGHQSDYYTFGVKADWPEYKKTINHLSENISPEIELILAKAINNLSDIIYWQKLAFRNCPDSIKQKIFHIRDLAMTQSDGTVYYPEIDDIAGEIDYASLHYAALKAAALTEETADSLIFYGAIPADSYFDILTPYGRIVFLGQDYLKKNKTKSFDCSNSLLVIDFGNNGHFTGNCGGTSISNPVSLFIDLGGDDTYQTDRDISTCGAGVMGVGVLYDALGNDSYQTKNNSQGFGFFGVGMLYDKKGDDKYRAELSGQGCGYFGIGLCFDAEGSDNYYIFGDGQGCGGVGGGIGVLADFSGDDFYKGEPDPKIFNRPDYHSKYNINASNVQGFGGGRRGDGSDGHSWAGGLGAIIDLSGDDHYLSGNWSLGCSYWFATGIAYDRSGNDRYESCYFTQGSGAHFCNAILIDEGGDDNHELYETAGAALGFGWDFANCLLINIGGNDLYKANMISLGLAQIRSFAFLIDIGGDDQYRLGKGTDGLGQASYRADFGKPRKLAPYTYYVKSLGCLIDIGGTDLYLSYDENNKEENHPVAKNDAIWFAPSKTDSTYGNNNYGIGIDIDNGIIPEVEKWND
ncbi:MAG: hypothetical protein GY865_02025 [candidate division Zixibacteria bacterium]|nr:hypothetical protein [candidate division Zixibacteria bacterium]